MANVVYKVKDDLNRMQVDEGAIGPAGETVHAEGVHILGGTAATTIADGADVAQGTTTDAATGSGANTTVIGALRAIRDKLLATLGITSTQLPAALGQTTKAGSLAVTMASDQEAMPVTDTWTPSLQAEETADDSDKTFTVPASTEWMVQSIWIELASNATVGNRQLEVQFQDSAGDVIGAIQASVVQAASLGYNYLFGLGLPDLLSLRDGTYLQTPLPAMILGAGFKIRVYDNNAIAAATDDMVIQMMVLARTV